jgi:peptidoglycan/LPS O-acetylase OafA/YrhL
MRHINPKQPSVATSYRPDIDGLRALAVLVVVLFHLGARPFAGGYVGVDVFFVISGYLITGLVEGDIAQARFSLRTFYLRRLRRLAPALLLMSTFACVAAYVVLYPEDMRSFAASLVAQFASLQNVWFLSEGEYFRNGETKLLLHTWSLAVEEQFYAVWPLLLLATRRRSIRVRIGLFIALAAASFALNLVFMAVSPKASFFLLPARAWELVAGGLLALAERNTQLARIPAPRWRSVASVLGLVAICFAVLTYSDTTRFPGVAAALPVVGAVLVIAAGIGGSSFVGKLLAHPILVHIGRISYPLYLWHWPFLALAHHLHYDTKGSAMAIAIGIASFVCAELTYRFVESPIRDRAWLGSPRALLAASGPLVALSVAYGVLVYTTDGAAFRYPPLARPFLTAGLAASENRCGFSFRVLHPRASMCALYTSETSDTPGAATRRVLLWGNSHADMWSRLFIDLGQQQHTSVYLTARNCRPLHDSAACSSAIQANVLASIDAAGITDVVLASTWHGSYGIDDAVFEKEMADLATKLAAHHVTTWWVVDPPAGDTLAPRAAYEKNPVAPVAGEVSALAYAPVHQRQLDLFATLSEGRPSMHIIDPTRTFCDAQRCVAGRDGQVWYHDPNHLTDDGARAALQSFTPVFRATR